MDSEARPKRDVVLEALENAGEYFDQRADAEYFTDGSSPVGNEEMTRLSEIKEAIAAYHGRATNHPTSGVEG